MNTDLIIVGAGAGGLMAAAAAAEERLRAVVVERRHQPGRKLLMCGNNRCNVTNALTPAEMVRDLGEPSGPFVRQALEKFSPADLRRWFQRQGLETLVHKDNRVFPRSEKADDVLHVFTDMLRDQQLPVMYNAPASSVERTDGGFVLRSDRFELRAPHLLLATGGVSYPKTGSVGDGQKFAKALGHRVLPYRPGLAGIELPEPWLNPANDISFPCTAVNILVNGRCVGKTSGEILCSRGAARGPAMVDASRLIARQELRTFELEVDLWPGVEETVLAKQIAQRLTERNAEPARVLAGWLLPTAATRDFVDHLIKKAGGGRGASTDLATVCAAAMKHWVLRPLRVRPLKEAMVTVGGVDLREVDPNTMQSRVCPGLFFAGEVLDIDGPTGGYNLQMAFSTAHLAVTTVAGLTKNRVPTLMSARLERPLRHTRN